MGGILERKERIGEMVEGLRDTIRRGEGNKNVKAAIVRDGRGEIKSPGAMTCPGLPLLWRVEGHDKLPGGMDGVGREVKGVRS